MTKRFDIKLFIILSFAFIIATVAGTLSHEFGHYVVAKSVGYKASIHYAHTHADDAGLYDSINAIAVQFRKQIKEDSSFPGKEKYKQLVHQYANNSLWISMGGPLQTILTGTIGLLLLFIWKKSFKEKQELRPGQWVLIFIALF